MSGNKKGVYVQVGAGAGDQDSRAGFRDGFTEYVKALDRSRIEQIVLVEPNPLNIAALRKCWHDYPQAKIIHAGIRPSYWLGKKLSFYLAEEDGPHFQVFSMRESHVKDHYPNGTIRTIEVETLTMQELLGHIGGGRRITLLALDIEGIDGDILTEINWKAFPCDRVSFEYAHLGLVQERVHKSLRSGGYIPIGWGLDVNGLDLMYARPSSLAERVALFWQYLVSGWWVVYRTLRFNRMYGSGSR